MFPIILKDELPRQLAYSVNVAQLCDQLRDLEVGDDVGLFLLFTSGVQIDYYDPVTSKAPLYPVLAVDNGPPQLVSGARAQLFEKRKRKEPDKGTGAYRVYAKRDDEEDEPELCAVSVSLFPVKVRIRRRVSDAVLREGVQPIRNWLLAESRSEHRPLVILYDETERCLQTKFAEEWTSAQSPRFYR